MKESEEEGRALSGPALEDYREHYSESRFWGKIGSLPGNTGRLLVQKSIELFVILTDRDTPAWARLLIMGALGYFICPLDLIPDPLPALGYVDDLAVMALLAIEMDRFLTPAMRERVQSLTPESMKQPTKTD